MRVLGAFHGYLGGPHPLDAGAEHMAHALLTHLARQGHQVDVALMWPRFDTTGHTVDGVRVHSVADGHRMLWSAANDVVVTHLDGARHALYAASASRTPTVLLLHNDQPQSVALATRYLRAPRLLTYNSDWLRDAYLRSRRFGEAIARLRHVVVHPPVDPDDYTTAPGDRVTLVNLYRRKGSALFWELADRMPDVRFLAVRGAYGDQDVPDRVPPNVEVIPTTRYMRDAVYARTAVLLVPSEYESWGRVAVEASCSGIPVIAAPTPGLREALGPGGTFLGTDDPDAWEEAVRDALNPSDGLRAELARHRAHELHDIGALQLRRWDTEIEALVRRA